MKTQQLVVNTARQVALFFSVGFFYLGIYRLIADASRIEGVLLIVVCFLLARYLFGQLARPGATTRIGTWQLPLSKGQLIPLVLATLYIPVFCPLV